MTDLQALPASIEMIADTIGVRLALKIVQVYGGQEIKFPKNPHDQHPVILALGKEDGYAICNYMGGNLLSVPHCRPPRSARAEIKRLEAIGLSRREIARRLGITQRWVRKAANGPPSNQMALFEFDDS
ncbi:helix-turn-helix domain-containing protein [Phyllobacterium leguminum]|uniref:Homeodomain-like domain-containing protein n=1 Tax=Phyllobacterium leguminum TaxID=314237 RepID=A0A318T5H3_9HYPH|nr:helix-turn-helix domain-containing protein [Phyllobacterium leguminum]PYE87522.1 Homeodomain-like domain-containing protein [Phyllobacterium leguminum]